MCKGMGSEECKELLDSIPDFNSLFTRQTPTEVQAVLDKHLAEPDDSTGLEKGGGVESAVDTAIRELEV